MFILLSISVTRAYTMRRKDDERERERYFQYTFYLILRLISVYTVYVEKVQSCGRVDCIIETPQYVYIFEFKLDGTADDALRQIEEKGYAREYASALAWLQPHRPKAWTLMSRSTMSRSTRDEWCSNRMFSLSVRRWASTTPRQMTLRG